jgi:hypothetical protein
MDEAPSFPLLRLSAIGVPFPHSHPATPPTTGLPRLDGGLLLPSTEPRRSPRPGTSDLSSPAASCSCSCSSRSREGGEILPVAVDLVASIRRQLVGVAAPVPASHHAARRCRDRRAVGGCGPPRVAPCRTSQCHAHRPSPRRAPLPTRAALLACSCCCCCALALVPT